ncbi:MAG: 4Fe-4S dicluster domain-containing protein [Crocinitomicaceae bacterium]
MKTLKYIGLFIFLIGFGLLTATPFIGSYTLTDKIMQENLSEYELEVLGDAYRKDIVGKTYETSFGISQDLMKPYKVKNEEFRSNEQWDKLLHTPPKDFAFKIAKASSNGFIANNGWLIVFLTFGLGIIGSLMYIFPNIKLMGHPGIKNDGIYHSSMQSRGWLGFLMASWFISLYIMLYFYPHWIVSMTNVVDPLKGLFIEGAGASQWFLYGLLYTVAMTVMGIRMIIKYRHNKYQIFRTCSVIFFQVVFAFMLVEILPIFNLPAMDLKNAWPLDYDFLFDWNVQAHFAAGTIGRFMFFWGIALSLVLIPLFAYIYGKRWYCSWVCGCGGLAETLGDPYRQLSNKKMWAWKLERWLVHGVLVFAIIMTIFAGYHTYNVLNNPQMDQKDILLGISAYDIRSWYGFAIGAIFAGVVGTGFYPIFGNRVWCRFGCPLAAYLGIVQRFKSRFRITTNGGQCISCGNCSTYCEQGIDVKAYAQRGQNIIRASCVGCGVCSAVCPRGVLKLENGPEEGRFGNDGPIVLGNEGFSLKDHQGE